jgi:NAD(P)-dependent dehydrogenase (short-subunit alcohol dehydrogenase family)
MAAAPLVDFTGRHIAVFGAAGDIGTTIVTLLLELGGRVTALDRDAVALGRLAALPGAQGALATVPVDVADEARMAAAFAGLGPIDGLVNGAAIEHRPTPTTQIDTDLFRKVIDINITGVFLGLKYGLPLLHRPGGSVVNFGSTAGIKGANGMSAYVASKHAVIGLTRCAAIEFGPEGLRVNAICPGPVEGRMIDSIMGSEPGQPSAAAAARMAVVPSRRFARGEEVARVVAFLLSDASSYVNGACYMVDGGISAI